MDEHTSVERKLKKDIHLKNLLRKDLVSHMEKAQTWREQLGHIRNNRRSRRIRDSIARYDGFVDELRGYILPMLEDLEKRIGEEMSFSEEEISGFKEDVTSEKSAVESARGAFEKARNALESAESDKDRLSAEETAAIRQAYSQAFRALRMERHRLETASEELKSELRDRDFFERELKRIFVEKHFLAGESTDA